MTKQKSPLSIKRISELNELKIISTKNRKIIEKTSNHKLFEEKSHEWYSTRFIKANKTETEDIPNF